MNGFERRTLDKKNAIIAAAQELFAVKGIADVSISDIAGKANVSRVTLFKYFGDKETLAREAIRSWMEHLMTEYEALISSNLPFSQKLFGLLSIRIAGREKIGEQFIHTAAWDDPELTRLFKEMAANHAIPKMMQLIDEGKRSGDIEASLDNDAILAYFSAFGPIAKNPEYITKGKSFHVSMFNLFMGGLIKDWYRKTDGLRQNQNVQNNNSSKRP